MRAHNSYIQERPRSRHRRIPVLMGGAFDYSKYLQATYPQLDRLDFQEPSGSAAAWNASASLPDAAHTATVVGVPTNFGNLGLGVTYNGATSFTNFYSGAFAAKFNPVTGTKIIWIRMANPGVWLDGSPRTAVFLGADANNRIDILKGSANDTISWRYRAGGIQEQINNTSINDTVYIMLSSTWEKPGDFTVFVNDAIFGTPQSIAGTWLGALLLSTVTIGAASTLPFQASNADVTRFMFGYTAEPLATIQDIYNRGAGI